MTEIELIALLTSELPKKGNDLACGVGDDCAIVAGPEGRDWLVTSDLLCEGAHFDLRFTDLVTLGRKALSVNLSDIAAMGGAPRFWLCSIALPGGVGAGGAAALYRGMNAVASEHGAILIGGDTSSSDRGLFLSITAIGECPSGRAVMRSGARPGDAIYATGELGGSALGLALMMRGIADKGAGRFANRHNDPRPRVEAGRLLAESGLLTSMIDISDGLMADLGHIAASSGAGFEVGAEALPTDATLAGLAAEAGADPLELALSGGEDYELAFTVASAEAGRFEREIAPRAGVRVTRIGAMVSDPAAHRALRADGVEINLSSAGFDHFGVRA
ncbi:MAG: thiamine-phosphate kinase [Proteobacteria bacterium]|nr:thiamine-phosphate kinase [Pseudomonadota bacterium]